MKETVAVSLDQREEQNLQLVDAYVSHEEVHEVSFTDRDVGDIVIAEDLEVIKMGGGIGFERKTPTDYAGSIREGKLDRQVEQLRNRYVRAYIAFEGDLSDTNNLNETNMRPQSIRGSMAKYTALKVPVLMCSTPELLADYTVRLARKHIEDTELTYLETGPVDVGSPAPMRMYGCLPGVGKDTAEKLYERYPVPASLLSVGIDDLVEIDGIGEKTAKRIINMVREEQTDA